jgi:hypothetical protein
MGFIANTLDRRRAGDVQQRLEVALLDIPLKRPVKIEFLPETTRTYLSGHSAATAKERTEYEVAGAIGVRIGEDKLLQRQVVVDIPSYAGSTLQRTQKIAAEAVKLFLDILESKEIEFDLDARLDASV